MHEQMAAIAFEGTRRLAIGPLAVVARAVRERLDQQAENSVLVLDARTSTAIDLDVRGTADEVERRYATSTPQSASIGAHIDHHNDSTLTEARGRGRPRLGVVAREVTLLPRHWSWLSSQPGGASVTLRRLVEVARVANSDKDRARLAAEVTYRFLMQLAGNEIGFEEATRALFAGERERFLDRIAQWPCDVREHAERLSEPVFAVTTTSDK